MKLHLGSGQVKLTGWLNVDLDSPSADVHLDLTKRLPFDDKSITHIFSEHFIEHISRDKAIDFLKECYRVLVENGVLRLSTPNLKYVAVSYLSRNLNEWGDLWSPRSPCQFMNEAFRLWGHKFLYDAEELFEILSETGFSCVHFKNYRESSIGDFQGIENRPFHNELIIEASKYQNLECTQEKSYNIEQDEPWLDIFNRTVLNQIKHLEQIVKIQIVKINDFETDRSSREQHIAGLEETIANQSLHIKNLQADRSSREQHITGLEADRSSREQHIAGLEETISNQFLHIKNLEEALSEFRASLYGKARIILKKLKQRF